MFFAQDTLNNTTKKDRETFFTIAHMLYDGKAKMKEVNKGSEKFALQYECHSICRAIKLVLKDAIEVIDGSFIGLKDDPLTPHRFQAVDCDHSWLSTPNGSIIDPFPIGTYTLAPLLLVQGGTYHPIIAGNYIPNPEVTTRRINRQVWRQAHLLARYFV